MQSRKISTPTGLYRVLLSTEAYYPLYLVPSPCPLSHVPLYNCYITPGRASGIQTRVHSNFDRPLYDCTEVLSPPRSTSSHTCSFRRDTFRFLCQYNALWQIKLFSVVAGNPRISASPGTSRYQVIPGYTRLPGSDWAPCVYVLRPLSQGLWHGRTPAGGSTNVRQTPDAFMPSSVDVHST